MIKRMVVIIGIIAIFLFSTSMAAAALSKSPILIIEDEKGNTKREQVTDTAVIIGLAKDILKEMTLEEKIGQLFIVNLELLDQSQGSYYEFRNLTNPMIQSLRKYHVGGVTLFSRNIETREQTIQLIGGLQRNSKYPMFITVDEEGGDVSRIASNDNMGTTKFPSMAQVGKTKDEEYVYEMGSAMGRELAELGFNVNFAPVADVKTNDRNKEIGNRSFGSDAKLVSKFVKQMVRGLQEQNVSAALKHFPGHGDVDKDSHDGAVNVENDIERLRKIDFVPFKAGVKEGADFLMVSHISISKVTEDTTPASMSSLVMNEMIRLELDFKGIVITDAMNMKAITNEYSSAKAAVASIGAGADVVLMPEELEEAYEAVLKAVKSGKISEKQLNTSVTRILQTKIKRGIIPQDTSLVNQK